MGMRAPFDFANQHTRQFDIIRELRRSGCLVPGIFTGKSFADYGKVLIRHGLRPLFVSLGQHLLWPQ